MSKVFKYYTTISCNFLFIIIKKGIREEMNYLSLNLLIELINKKTKIDSCCHY